jgi:DNA polymerase delta subunit 2
MEIAGQKAKHVERVLDVRQGELVWVVGTVYMDLPLKPNVLEDLARDVPQSSKLGWFKHFITAPPPREKYIDENGNVAMMLEDESGRIELSGSRVFREGLVTGCVIGVLGSETTGGQFDVVDVCLPEMAPQAKWEDKMGISGKKRKLIVDNDNPNYIAFASGLDISGDMHESLETHLMMEYLTGELLCPAVCPFQVGSNIWRIRNVFQEYLA